MTRSRGPGCTQCGSQAAHDATEAMLQGKAPDPNLSPEDRRLAVRNMQRILRELAAKHPDRRAAIEAEIERLEPLAREA